MHFKPQNEKCDELSDCIDSIASDCFEKIISDNSELSLLFDNGQFGKLKLELINYLEHLAASVFANDKNLFLDYIHWNKILLSSNSIPPEYQTKLLEQLVISCSEYLSNDTFEIISDYINFIKKVYQTLPTEIDPLFDKNEAEFELAEKYLELLLNQKKLNAEMLIMSEVESGKSIKEIYLQVFQPVLHEVGRLWQTNQINVAVEHYCSRATEFIMSRLYEYIFNPVKKDKSIISTSVSGERHQIGSRMISEFFEMEGWESYYLGADTPDESVIQMLNLSGSDVLAISCSMTSNILQVEELISKVRKNFSESDLLIIVGGRPFNLNTELWKLVGADCTAEDSEKAVETINELIS